MKRGLFFTFFFFGIFCQLKATSSMEILPREYNGFVAADKVVVRGYFESSDKIDDLRLKVTDNGSYPIYFNEPGLAVYREREGALFTYFYYVENVPVSGSGTEIKLEKLTNPDNWDVLFIKEIYLGNVTASSPSEFKKTMWGRIANNPIKGNPMRGIFYFGGPENIYYRQAYSRYPESLEKYKWQDYSDIDFLFDEMKMAGVNTIKMSYWGDWDEEDSTYKTITYNDGTVVKDRLWMVGDPGFYNSCDYQFIPLQNKCFELKESTSENSVNTHEMEICYGCSLINEEPTYEMYLKSLKTNGEQENCFPNDECCQLFGHVEEENCRFISVPKKEGGYWEATTDSRAQVFQTALLKDMTVVPVIEVGPEYVFSPIFPDKSYILRNRIIKLLEKYGSYESWLELYNNNGEKRKAVFLLVSLYFGNPFLKDMESEFDVISNEIFNITGYKIGFVLDTSPLGGTVDDMGAGVPFHDYTEEFGGTYIPQPEKLMVTESFLAINPFNITSDVGLSSAPSDNSFYPIDSLYFDDSIRLYNSYRWLKYWYETGIPLISTATPGFDDRRGRPDASQFYGDSDLWNYYMEKTVRRYNSAGITLDIWNAFTEGYVFVPMEPFFNKWYQVRNGNENYEFAKILFWEGTQKRFNQDEDADNVIDLFDNCLGVYNPAMAFTLKREDISGTNGAIIKRFGHLQPEWTGFTKRYIYKMQPDSDLDGIGDACDYDSSAGGGFANSRITNAKPKTIIPSITSAPVSLFRAYNHYAEINLTMPSGSGRESSYCTDSFIDLLGNNIYRGSSCNAAVHYCAINYEEAVNQNQWGEAGYCSTSDKEGGSVTGVNFGYSHASDNFDIYSRTSWRSRISVSDNLNLSWSAFTGSSDPNDDTARKPVVNSNASFKLVFGENGTIWNWRRDWYEKKRCNDPDNSEKAECQSLKSAAAYNVSHTMYYTLSTSILPVAAGTPNENIPRYLINVNNETIINPAYFPSTNTSVNARAARYKTEPMELNFYSRSILPPVPPETIEIPEIVYCPSCYWNIPIENILDEQGIPEAFSINHIGRWLTGKDENGNYMMNSQHLYFPENMTVMSEMTEHAMVAVRTVETLATGETEYQLLLNTSENGADWEFLGNISNWDSEISSIRAIVSNDSGMYFIARLGDSGRHLFRVSVNGDVPEITDPENLPEITYSLHNLGLTGIGDDTLENEKLISVDNKLFVIGADSAGAGTRTFKSASGEAPFTEITGLSPASRKIYNLKVAGKYIFLTGGMNANNGSMNDMWRFDTETEIWEQIPITLNGDFRKVITQFVDGKLVMVNPVMTGNLTHPAFEIDPDITNINDLAASMNYVEIPVTEAVYESMDKYCLNETGTLIKGGLEMSGECVPFTHPWYRSFSTGSTIYSVAGKGDRLYVGTNNSIKVYDISDPNAFVLKSTFLTSNRRVYDLEVAENDIMYAATSGGLYKLDTANPDVLTSLSFFATNYNYQYRIQLYNDKLYVGDDNGINIRDKETFARLAYVNIDSVLDFAIANGEIALYRSSFWSAGLHIRDVETLNLKAYEYAECYTGELTTDHGAFYLSCDGYEYRFEGRPDTYFNFYPLDGDIREMQENHVYNGWTYIPDGSSVKLSTLNDVPSYCGNGVIEPGELCDGNSVACTTISSSYVSGTAYCNSTCDGYNESNCSTDGW